MRSLSQSTICNYLSKIFKRPILRECIEFENAVEILRGFDDLYVPEGLDESCAVVCERMAVRGGVLSLTPSKALAKLIIDVAGAEGRGYLLLTDADLPGADSLFLCAVGIFDTAAEVRADVTYHVDSYFKHGCPNIVIGNCKDPKTGCILHITAAQLTSLLP